MEQLIHWFEYIPKSSIPVWGLGITLLIVAGLVGWWLKVTKGKFNEMLIESFENEQGKGSALKFTAFLFSLIMAFLLIRGALLGIWPPQPLVDSLLLFIAALLGINPVAKALENRQSSRKVEVINSPENPVPTTERSSPE